MMMWVPPPDENPKASALPEHVDDTVIWSVQTSPSAHKGCALSEASSALEKTASPVVVAEFENALG